MKKNNNAMNNYKFNTYENVNMTLGRDTVEDKLLLVIKNSENKKMLELEITTDKDKKIDAVTKMELVYKYLFESRTH